MNIDRLVIVKPSGNTTAIVFDEITPNRMRSVGASIQGEFPSVEQVLFVQKRFGRIHGQMAGGEFCGNAARSLGYVLADGKDSVQTFTMSGLSKPVAVHVKGDYATLKMQTRISYEKINLENAPVSIVHLEGISHAVIDKKHPLFENLKAAASRPDRKQVIEGVLGKLNLIKRPASGLIFCEDDGTTTKITPFVYVRNINTLYSETSCASGSLAAATVLGRSASILQPSGEVLDVTVKSDKPGSIRAEIGGKMSIMWQGVAKDICCTTASVRRRVLSHLRRSAPALAAV